MNYNISFRLGQLVLACCMLAFGSIGFGQTELFAHQQFTNAQGETLYYRQLQSDYDANSKYPLVLFLHGSGERGSDNEAQLKWGVRSFTQPHNMAKYRPIVIAPQCPKGQSWADFSRGGQVHAASPTEPMRLLKELIDDLINNQSVDPNRIYITGLSMGGFGTFDAITRYPDLFAAAVPVCGGGDPATVNQFSHIPLWIFHGAHDTSVPASRSQDMLEALSDVGAKVGYTQYPEAGHFSWIAAYNDDLMMSWLFSQRK